MGSASGSRDAGDRAGSDGGLKPISGDAVRAGYTGTFEITRPILPEEVFGWKAAIGMTAAVGLPTRRGGQATWWYIRDVIEGDEPQVVIVRRDIDAVMDFAGFSVGQLGG